MDNKSRKTEHLDFNEVWFADGDEFGVVLQVRCVVIFDESKSVDSSLSLQTAITNSFCQFRRTTWTLLLVVSPLLLQDFGTLFHWTVELLHQLTHLRSVLRHFSLIRHNRTVARTSVLWRDINLLIEWLIDWLCHPLSSQLATTNSNKFQHLHYLILYMHGLVTLSQKMLLDHRTVLTSIQSASVWSLTAAAPSDNVFRALWTNWLNTYLQKVMSHVYR